MLETMQEGRRKGCHRSREQVETNIEADRWGTPETIHERRRKGG